MADNRKYYYMRLKESFFDDDVMKIIESMPDGYLYSNILLKLYLKSLKYDGRLMFNERIPYNAAVLATVTGHQVGTVEKALDIFAQLDLIEVLDNGAIYMLDIQNLIGKSSTEGDRKKEYRKRIQSEKLQLTGQMSGHLGGQMPPEIEKDIEKEKEIDIEVDNGPEVEEPLPTPPTKPKKSPKKKKSKEEEPKTAYGETYQNVMLTEKEYETLIAEFGDKGKKAIEFLDLYIEETGYKRKSHYLSIRRWVINAVNEQEQKQQRVSRSNNPANTPAKNNRFNNFEGRNNNLEAMVWENFRKKQENPPKTAAEDESIRARAEALKKQFV